MPGPQNSRKLLLLLLPALLVVVMIGCERVAMRRAAAHAIPSAQGGPVVLAIYQPWFGEKDHIDVGYSSLDRNVQQRQVERAKDLGIEGFVVDWYGPHKTFMDRGYGLMQQVALENGFHVALLYDESSDGDAATDTTISDLQYAYEHYIGPKAGQVREAYLTYDGRPVIFVFPKSNKTDWKRVRQATSDWEQPPLIINEYRNNPKDAQFDGLYVWVHPGKGGWASDGSHWGGDYLDSFYHNMVSEYPDKVAVGGAWAKFDDSRASWSQNRHISGRCGKTFEETLRAFRRYYDDRNPLPFLLIETWNDYEEGTAIEPGIPSCHDRSKMDIGQ